jgi:hypothetical protein
MGKQNKSTVVATRRYVICITSSMARKETGPGIAPIRLTDEQANPNIDHTVSHGMVPNCAVPPPPPPNCKWYMQNAVFWDVTSCDASKNQRFGGMDHLHHQGDKNRRARNNVSSN